MLPLYGISGIFSLPLNMQAGDFAEKYAEKKYGIGFDVSSSTYFRHDDNSGLFLVNLHPIVDKKVAYCQVGVLYRDPNNFSIEDTKVPDDCGKSITNGKFTNFLEENIINKYYNLKDVYMGAFLEDLPLSAYFQCRRDIGKGCESDKVIDVFNSNQNWNLTIEELLKKYSNNLAIKSVSINIFNQKETPESIAKAMEFAFELNKYLSRLTGTRKVKTLVIYIYS